MRNKLVISLKANSLGQGVLIGKEQVSFEVAPMIKLESWGQEYDNL